MKGIAGNTWVEIDLDLLAHNMRVLRDFVGEEIALSPVIKADAYGHGAVMIARELQKIGVEQIAVATLPEALELRTHGITTPVHVMGYIRNEALAAAVEHNVTLTIFEYEQAEIISREARSRGIRAKVHIKLDTGFHRLGTEASPAFVREIARMRDLPGLELEGIFSHLRLADTQTDQHQFEVFADFVQQCQAAGISFKYRHMSDSIGAIKYKNDGMNMIRPGAIIYGYLPKYQAGRLDVKPIMTFKTTVARVHSAAAGEGVGYDEDFKTERETVIATLAVGYSDGYSRALSRIGEVLVGGKRARIMGLICMDQMMVDVTGIEGVRTGDEVVLFGPQEGAPRVEELALLLKTNKNELISGIRRRVPRVYFRGGKIAEITDYMSGRVG